MAYRLGVDVGGTFTDLFLVSQDNGGGQFRVKTPSTPHDPSEGVLTGVRRICEEGFIGGQDGRLVGQGRSLLEGGQGSSAPSGVRTDHDTTGGEPSSTVGGRCASRRNSS